MRGVASLTLLRYVALLTVCCDGTPNGPGPLTVTITGDKTVLTAVGETVQLRATVTFANGTSQDQTNAAAWVSSNRNVATANATGLVTAVGAGEAEIRATYEGTTGRLVLQIATPSSVVVTAERTVLGDRGETVQLTATVRLPDGTAQDQTKTAEWSSSRPEVATVNQAGLVTSVSDGETRIEATYKGVSGALFIRVDIPPPRVELISPADGDTVGLRVTFRWRVRHPEPGWTYRFELRLDKGVDACDSGFEDMFDASTQTSLTVDLDPPRYRGQSADWGVRTADSRGRTLCTNDFRFRVK